jgi:hypothetical protein
MPKALNRVRLHCTDCLDLETHNHFTTVRNAQFLLLERKITGDERNQVVVFPLHICPDCFLVDDYRHRNDPPLPPVPCQICGKPGYKERYCPNALELGF